MAEVRRTLIPQFTLRGILMATAAMGVVSLAIGRAYQGDAWAWAIVLGLIAGIVALLTYAATFILAWLFSEVLTRFFARRRARSQSAGATIDKSTAAIIVCLLLAAANSALAGSGATITLPIGWTKTGAGPQAVQNKSGLTLSIDNSWVDSFGYRPLRVEIQSVKGPVTSDRVVTVTFRPMQGYTQNPSTEATQTLEIPAGGTSAKMIMAVPSFGAGQWFSMDVYEDGRKIKELCIPEQGGWASWSGTDKGDDASPVTLVLDNFSSPLASSLASGNPQIEMLTVGPVTTTTTTAPGAAATVPAVPSVATFADLPENWILYTGFDSVVTSFGQLKTLASGNPKQWRAVRDWVRSGGNLIVADIDTKWEELPELEALLDERSSKDAKDGKQSWEERGWELPLKQMSDQPLMGVTGTTIVNPDGSVEQDTDNFGDGTTTDGTAAKEADKPATEKSEDEKPAADASEGEAPKSKQPSTKKRKANDLKNDEPLTFDNARFIYRHCGLGMVVAVRHDRTNVSTVQPPWAWIYNTLGQPRWQWYQRHGVSLVNSNNDFWKFLIPGIGLAPVRQFQVIITLFVLIIGPITYYLLRKSGKLNLIVIIVPAAALLITGMLFLYAIIADGLSVRVRARSFTHIDQRAGDAACWARLSYYAGLAPSDGLKFTEDTAVIPLDSDPSETEGGPPRTVHWAPTDSADSSSPLEQRLPDGWLNARTPTQLITTRIRKSPAHLEIKSNAAGKSKPPAITNRLGTPIQWLLVVDDDGKCYVAESVGPDAAAELKPVESQDAALKDKLLGFLAENEPRVPQAIRDSNSFFGLSKQSQPYVQNYYRRNWRYRNIANNNNAIQVTQGSSILERSIANLPALLTSNLLPPRTYLAVVEKSPEVQFGTPTAEQEASFHVVSGEW